MAEPGLEIEGVEAGYGPRPVLRGVSMSVASGEVVGLIGPNGSGKTTAVRVASRVLRPAAGTVRVGGDVLFDLSPREAARRVAVVPQELAPTFPFSVLEMVLMGRAPHLPRWSAGESEDFRRAREAMEVAQVHHLADRELGELSGGERQRVVLAQALAQDAPVLLLDEPTSHLDVRHMVGILDTVRRLSRGRPAAVLAIFHDLNLAAAYCDRLVALADGRVVAEGPPRTVVTRELLTDVYGVEAEVTPHFATGQPTVQLGPALEPLPAGGLPRAHVVGGAGRGGPAMRILAEAGYEVTAGALHGSDTDAVIAERLNLERIAVPPFSPVDDAATGEVLVLMRAAELVVVCDAPYGPGNVGNLEAAVEAAEGGTRVVLVEETPPAERDFTGGFATELWERLAAAGKRVGSYDALAREVERP